MSDPTPGAQPPITAPAGTPPAADPPIEEKKFSQAELDTLIKERLDRQRRALETQQREAQQALETQKLEDQKEFEKLAKQRAEEINSLKPRATMADSMEKQGALLMAKASESLPSSMQMLLNKLPITHQLDWLIENLDSVMKPPVTTPSSDINAWSRTTSSQPQQLTDEEYRAKKRREIPYS